MVNKLRVKLTERQSEVLAAIENFVLSRGFSPSIRELGKELEIAHPSAVFKHVLSLERKGYLTRTGGDVRLTGARESIPTQVKVPLVGFVPAGYPKETFDVSGEALDVPDWMVGRKKGNIFCIQVEGKSMVDAFIDDGDRVLLERTNSANSGEMVVALLDDGSVTLKRLKVERGEALLVPENPAFEVIKAKNLKILGKVIGVMRKY